MSRGQISTACLGCLLALASLGSATASAAGAITASGRIGIAAPVNGDVQDQLNLDVGLGAGASLAYDLFDFLSLDVRYDALLLYGSVLNGVDSSTVTHAVSFGPQLEFREDPFELYVGFHPGAYFTQLSMSGKLQGPVRPREINVDSDWSVDFGFNTQAGTRVFLTNELFLGAEVGYHLVFLDDSHLGFDIEGTPFHGGKIDDHMGSIDVGATFGYRF